MLQGPLGRGGDWIGLALNLQSSNRNGLNYGFPVYMSSVR
jgi:hypothetical protein